jgi:hypothetical protein
LIFREARLRRQTLYPAELRARDYLDFRRFGLVCTDFHAMLSLNGEWLNRVQASMIWLRMA